MIIASSTQVVFNAERSARASVRAECVHFQTGPCPRTRTVLAVLVSIVIALGQSTSVHASTIIWSPNSNGGDGTTWNTTGANWDSAGTLWDAGAGPTNVAVFQVGGTPGVSGTVYCNGITFSQPAAIASNTITLAGTTPVIRADAYGTISSVVAGSAGLAKYGWFPLALPTANTYTNGTTVNGGLIVIPNESSLGTYPGSFQSANIVLNGGGGVGNSATGIGNTSSSVTLSANRGIVLGPGLQNLVKGWRQHLYVNGVISGSGGLIIGENAGYNDGSTGGGGRDHFSGANTYTGDTVFFDLGVQDPGLIVENVNALQNTTVDYNSVTVPAGSGFVMMWAVSNPVLGGLKGNKNLNISFQSNPVVIQLGNNNKSTIFSGVISGSTATTSLTKIGTGTLTLSGANSTGWTGGVTVTNGTLIGTTSTALGNGKLTVYGGATFAYLPTSAGTLGLGSGVVTLQNGAAIGTAIGGSAGQSTISSSSGAVVAGTIMVNVSGIPGVAVTAGVNNLLTVGSGLSAATFSLGKLYNTCNFTVTGGTFGQSDTAVYVSVAPAAALTNEYWLGGFSGGNNVWAVSDGSAASNWTTDSGGTTGTGLTPGPAADVYLSATGAVQQGSMVLGANMSIKSLTIGDTSTVTLNADGNQLTIAGAGGITVTAGAGAVTLNPFIALGAGQTWLNNSSNLLAIGGEISNGSNALTIDGTGNTLISGQIRYGNGALNKNGNGTLTLAGPNVTFRGSTTVNAGTVVAGDRHAFGLAVADINGFTYGWGYANVAFGNSSTGKIQLNGNNVVLSSLSSGSPVGTPVVENGSSTNVLLTVTESTSAAAAATHTYAGVLQDGPGGGSVTLHAPTVGTLTLSGSNSYSGGTIISGGTLKLGNANALGGSSAGPVSVRGGALDLSGFTPTTSSVMVVTLVSGSITNSGPVAVLAGAGYNVQSGSVSANLGGPGVALTKTTSGSVTLSGTNTYGGTTAVKAGTLSLARRASLYNDVSPNWTPALINVESGATLSLGVGASLSGYFDTADIATLLDGSHMGMSTTTSGMKSGSMLGFDTSNAGGSYTYNSNIADPGTSTLVGLKKVGAGTLYLGGTNTYSGSTAVSAGTLQFAARLSLYNGVTNNWTKTNITVASGATLAVNVGGSGELTVDEAKTVLSNLTVSINNNGMLAGSAFAIDTANAGSDATFDQVIADSTGTGSGSVGLTKLGANALILDQANTYSGSTVVNGGVLLLKNATALKGGIGSSGGATALTLNGGVIGLGAGDFQRPLGTAVQQVQWTGSGGFAAYAADRTVNLGGASAQVTWAGGSFVPAGSTLILGSTGADRMVTFQNPIALNGAVRTIQVENGTAPADALLGNVISGTGGSGITKTGGGTVMLSGANTYSGGTTISNGTLLVCNTTGSGTGTGAVGVSNGATVGGTGSITGAVAVASGGHIAPGTNSTGTLTLTGAGTCLTLADNAILDWELGDFGSVTNDMINLTGAASTIAFGTNAVLNLARGPGVTGDCGSRVVLVQYTGSDPILPAWTFSFGNTGFDRGKVLIDSAAKQVVVILVPRGTSMIVR